MCLHASTGSSQMWVHQAGAFAAAGYRFIAYDRRGHGRSVVEEGAASDSATDDLHRLLDHLGLERIHLLGTAAGGIVALDFALSFPKRLRSLAVANSIGGVRDEDYLALQRRLRPSPQFSALPPEVRELGPSYRATNAEGVRRWLELEHRSRTQGAPAQKLRNRITFSLLETISVPTLLLTGDADLYSPPPVLRLFTDRIAKSKSVVIPACGHSAYWEQPELFNRTVLDFIGKH